MVAEGGCGQTNMAQWVRDWFFVPEVLRPHYRYMTWLDANGYPIEESTGLALSAYRPSFKSCP